MKPPLHIVLICPEIPPNTGNIGRLCAVTDCRLHLIHPLGFSLEDKQLRRAGMDYWHELDVHHHDDWGSFLKSANRPQRLWLLTTKAEKNLWDTQFQPGDGLVFGNEGSGAPADVHAYIGSAFSTKIPQFNEQLRSLNLSTACGIATYEALRQIRTSL